MANTIIQIKKSSTASAVPSALEYGELAINYRDGKLYYKNVNNFIVEFSPPSVGNYFGTVNANSVLLVADTSGDILSIEPGSGIAIVADAANDKLTISATGGPGGGGAYFQGNNGDVGDVAGLGDIFRVHSNTLTANVTIFSGNNSLAAGPITISQNRTLTIQTGARVAIV